MAAEPTARANGADEVDLIDYARVVYKRRRLVGWAVGSAFVLSIVVSLLLPKIYAATTSILPPQQDSSLAAPLMFGGSGTGSGQTAGPSLAASLLGLNSPGALWQGILESQTVADALIGRFKLKQLYGSKTTEDARNALARRVTIESSDDGIVSVTVEDRDPKRAAEMANAFVQELDRINRQAVTTAGGRMRAFIEQRLAETRRDLAAAENALKKFQENNRAVQVDDQARAIISAYGQLKGKLAAKEVQLGTLLSYATANHPQVRVLKSEIEEINRQLRQLQKGNPAVHDIFLPTDEVPDLGVQYVRLTRDVKYQETLFELLTQQYEMARIQEAKDTPTVQILDVAKVPEKKAKPRRTLIVLLSTAAALFCTTLAAFFLDYLEAHRLRDEATRQG